MKLSDVTRKMASLLVDPSRRPPGFVVRLPTTAARAWDLVDKLP